MILTIYMMSLHRTLLHFTYPSRQILLISIVTVKSMKMGQIKVRKGEQQPFKTKYVDTILTVDRNYVLLIGL